MTSYGADAAHTGDNAPADVSVIIPTHDRPDLVGRAIRSAATQRPRPLEIIVVSDGPDARIAAVVGAAAPAPCRYIELPEARGAPAARNAGIAAAVGTWIALLDDDDEWLPGKLARQLTKATVGPCRQPIVSCAVEVRGAGLTYVLPRRSPDQGEPVGDWLMVRHGPFHGEGFVQTSTPFARCALFQAVSFDEPLGRLQDTDWLLRAIASGACSRCLMSFPCGIPAGIAVASATSAIGRGRCGGRMHGAASSRLEPTRRS